MSGAAFKFGPKQGTTTILFPPIVGDSFMPHSLENVESFNRSWHRSSNTSITLVTHLLALSISRGLWSTFSCLGMGAGPDFPSSGWRTEPILRSNWLSHFSAWPTHIYTALNSKNTWQSPPLHRRVEVRRRLKSGLCSCDETVNYFFEFNQVEVALYQHSFLL